MKIRACVRLDRDAVLRTQGREVKGGHDGSKRGRGRLMSSDLYPVFIWPEMIGIVDHPGGKPQHLALERRENSKPLVLNHGSLVDTTVPESMAHGIRAANPGSNQIAASDR